MDNLTSETASELSVASTEERSFKRESLDISEVTQPLDGKHNSLDFALVIVKANVLPDSPADSAKLLADADWGFHHKFSNALSGEGTTAFGSRQGGKGSEDGDGGPFHRIPVDEGDRDSLTEIEPQLSPALNNTSFTSDLRDEQPAPNGSPSNIEMEPEPILEEPVFNWSDMHKTFLLISVDEVLATSTIKFGAGGSVPENVRILLSSAQLCSVTATFLCSCGYIFERSRKAKLARMMTAGGVVAATCTLALMTGSLLANFK